MLVLSARIVLIFDLVANPFFEDLKMCRCLVLDVFFVLIGPSLAGLTVRRLVSGRGLAAVAVTMLLVGRAQITFVLFRFAMTTRSIPHKPLAWSTR